VHKTDYIPKNGNIMTPKSARVKHHPRIYVKGKERPVEIESARDTVHLAVNGEVSPHNFAQHDYRYAVLVPFEDIKDQVGYAAGCDTFTKGDVKLGENAWILCPKEDREEVMAKNPGIKVVGFEGEKAMGYPNPFLTKLGYRFEQNNQFAWNNHDSNDLFCKIMADNGIKIGNHADTHFYYEEQLSTFISTISKACGLLKSEKLIATPGSKSKSDYTFEDFINENPSLRNVFSSLIDNSLSGNTESTLVKDGHHIDVFAEQMKAAKVPVSQAYINVIKKIWEKGFNKFEGSEVDALLAAEPNLSDTERANIELLRAYDYRKYYCNYFTDFMEGVLKDSLTQAIDKDRNSTREP
jgi:hypothetical protein